MVGYVASDDAVGADHAPRADVDTSKHGDLFPDPGVVTDGGGCDQQSGVETRWVLGIEPVMVVIGDVAVRGDQDAVTYVYR